MQEILIFSTKGRGFNDITDDINKLIQNSNYNKGLCNLYIKHTSCSLIISENYDKKVLNDLETFMQNQIPDGSKWLTHRSEGPDDMPAHIRTVLTCSSISIPMHENALMLGTWQAVYLWEHRLEPHTREVVVSLISS